MKYTTTTGAWVNPDNVKDGQKAKLVEETRKEESTKYKDKDGAPRIQNVTKIRFQGDENVYNASLNWTTIFGLVAAFGEESKEWVGKTLTVRKREQAVGDRLLDVLYYIPEGFELAKNRDKKLEIRKAGDPEIATEEPDEIPF